MNKKLLPLFIVCCLWFQYTTAQYVTLPDPNFTSWIENNIPGAVNGLGQLDTTYPGVVDNTEINCSGSFITSLEGIEYFKNLKSFDCSRNSIDTLPSLAHSVQYLRCGENYLQNLTVLPTSLLLLDCHSNQLFNLPALPVNLKSLNCSGNAIVHLPLLPDSLSSLFCNTNQLDSLPSLPGNLDSLDCSINLLQNLPLLPNSLHVLICTQNQLSGLPGASFLKYLDCSLNRVTSLPTYGKLQCLMCSDNQITRLPLLPRSLNTLWCDNNYLDSLISLPDTLLFLECDFNHLTTLGSNLPNSLQSLACSHNKLSNVPSLPNTLRHFKCAFNLLDYLPSLPDSMFELACPNNPDLKCLPKLTRINLLIFDSTAVSCLPNYGNVTTSIPPLNSLPLCDSTNNTGCPYYTSIPDIKNLAFSISPNPASNEVLLTLNEASAEFSIIVFDVTGRKVITEKNHTGTYTLFVNQLPAGLYFVQLNDDRGGVGIKKLVVEH